MALGNVSNYDWSASQQAALRASVGVGVNKDYETFAALDDYVLGAPGRWWDGMKASAVATGDHYGNVISLAGQGHVIDASTQHIAFSLGNMSESAFVGIAPSMQQLQPSLGFAGDLINPSAANQGRQSAAFTDFAAGAVLGGASLFEGSAARAAGSQAAAVRSPLVRAPLTSKSIFGAEARPFVNQFDTGLPFEKYYPYSYDTALPFERYQAPSSGPTGQIHHPISKPIARVLEEHPILAGQYTPRDPRFTTQAIDRAAHQGYQTWHRELDSEVSQWIRNNPQATPPSFESWLRGRYTQPDLKVRFPNGF